MFHRWLTTLTLAFFLSGCVLIDGNDENGSDNADSSGDNDSSERGWDYFPDDLAPTASVAHIETDGTYSCDGILIDATVVIVPANCIDGAASIDVIAGDFNNLGSLQTINANAGDVTLHPDYDGTNFNIGFITLSSPFTINADIVPMDMSTAEPLAVYDDAETGILEWLEASTGLALH